MQKTLIKVIYWLQYRLCKSWNERHRNIWKCLLI